MSDLYQPGDTVFLRTTFVVDGTLTDPSTVTYAIRPPTGGTISYVYGTDSQVTKESTGVYLAEYTAATYGLYTWTATGTGAAKGVIDGDFTVEQALIGSYRLCSVDDVKTTAEIDNTASDDLIESLVVAASAVLPERYQREFVGPTGGTRSFPVRGGLIDLAPFDLRTPGAVILHPEESATSLVRDQDYQLRPEGGFQPGATYTAIRLSPRLNLSSTLQREFGEARLQVAGDWGCFPEGQVVGSVRRAAAVTAASWIDRAVSDIAIIGEDPRELRPDRFSTWAVPYAAHAVLSTWGRLGTP
ncbi:MAG: hypothetical protein AB7O78_01690 [Thermoleophilia bacterium]